MTLLLGARCTDGVVLAADRIFTNHKSIYGKKITGELDGVLTGFAGDRGSFTLFTAGLRKFVDERTRLQAKHKAKSRKRGVSIDSVIWEINSIRSKLKWKFYVLMGVSGSYFGDNKSRLYKFYYVDGCVPIEYGYEALGTGAAHCSYLLNKSHREDMKMNEFAQLADLAIRFVSDNDLADGEVGFDKKYPYPQIIYIPDEPTGKWDHELTDRELDNLKQASDKKLKNLYDLQF